MKEKLTAILIGTLLSVLSSCENTTVVGHTYPAVPVSSVKVLYQEPKRPYEVLAFVQSNKSWEMSSGADVADLRKKAANVGSDALIVTSVHGVTMTEWDSASGKAINGHRKNEKFVREHYSREDSRGKRRSVAQEMAARSRAAF